MSEFDRKTNPPEMPPQAPELQKMTAMVIPVPLFMQMVELIRGSATHRDADPLMQQIQQLQPQEVTLRND